MNLNRIGSMGFLLKVLSGSNQGAEFNLPEEEITLGTDDLCDVVLSDNRMEKRHVQVCPTEGAIKISPLEGAFFVDGKKYNEATLVSPFQFVTIGETLLMFGAGEDKRWDSISVTDAPPLEIPVETVPEKEEDPKKPSDNLKTESILPKGLRSRFWKYSLRFFFLFILALIISTSAVILTERPIRKKASSVSIEQRIKALIDGSRIKNKLKISKVDDTISVVGYVESMANSAQLKSSIRAISDNIHVKIFSTEKILNAVDEIILQSKKAVKMVPSDEFGHFIAKGFVYKADVWEKLKSEILSVKGIIRIKDDVFSKVTAVNECKALLREYGFDKQVEPKATQKGLLVEGTIPDDSRENWDKAKTGIEKAFKKILEVNFMINVSSDRNLTVERFFGGKIDSVNFSEQGLDWVNIKNGNKYFKGSVLPSGYIVEDIQPNSITIKNADEVLKLDLDWI